MSTMKDCIIPYRVLWLYSTSTEVLQLSSTLQAFDDISKTIITLSFQTGNICWYYVVTN